MLTAAAREHIAQQNEVFVECGNEGELYVVQPEKFSALPTCLGCILPREVLTYGGGIVYSVRRSKSTQMHRAESACASEKESVDVLPGNMYQLGKDATCTCLEANEAGFIRARQLLANRDTSHIKLSHNLIGLSCLSELEIHDGVLLQQGNSREMWLDVLLTDVDITVRRDWHVATGELEQREVHFHNAKYVVVGRKTESSLDWEYAWLLRDQVSFAQLAAKMMRIEAMPLPWELKANEQADSLVEVS